VANTLTEVIPKILANGLKCLRENAVMSRLVTRDYQGEAAQKGDVINIPLSSALTVSDVSPSVAFVTGSDATPTSAKVTLDFWKRAGFYMTDKNMKEAMDGHVPRQSEQAVKSLANAVDQFILGKHVGLYGLVGTPGTTPFNGSLTVAKDARVLLNKQLAPLNDRVAVLDPDAEGNLGIVPEVLKANERGDNQGIIEGVIAKKLGFQWYLDQNLTAMTYTPGTAWATGYTVSSLSATAGDTTLKITNTTTSGTIKVGDIFTIGGAEQQYVVTVTATFSATVPMAITFKPALASDVSAAIALTVIGTAYVPNIAFHPDAIAWASRPLGDIAGLGNDIMSMTDPVSGITLRVEAQRQNKQTLIEFDILGGANVIRPELAVKIAG
jgi:hypothetical protein